MDGPLTIYEVEPLDAPVLLIAYAGWSDGGQAATTAAKSLLEQFSMSLFARIDTEEFLDLTVVRPHVRLGQGEQREIVWPDHEFFAARLGPGSSDLLVGLGVEPHLRWKAYSRAVIELVQASGARMVVLMGAYLDDVIYSQPVQVAAYASDLDLLGGLRTSTPSYEGETGIVGVLGDALRRAGIPWASLWARIPHYVPTRPNSRGALALLHAFSEATNVRFDTAGVESDAARFDETVSQLIATDPQLSAYVRELKKRVFSS